MLTSLLIFLLVWNAVTTKQDRSIFFSRTVITALIFSSFIAFYPRKVYIKGYSSLYKILTFKFLWLVI